MGLACKTILSTCSSSSVSIVIACQIDLHGYQSKLLSTYIVVHGLGIVLHDTLHSPSSNDKLSIYMTTYALNRAHSGSPQLLIKISLLLGSFLGIRSLNNIHNAIAIYLKIYCITTYTVKIQCTTTKIGEIQRTQNIKLSVSLVYCMACKRCGLIIILLMSK